MSNQHQETKWSQFGVLISVFFFWGFVAAGNSIFIPFCKKHFGLDQIQSQLIGSAYYGAYFYGSLILYMLSNSVGYDILNKIGYKKGIVYGLLISILGAVLLAWVCGGTTPTFAMVLVSFFIIALGFSLQQTSAQPFAISLGSEETGAHRLNMAGGINSFGTLMGPIVVSIVLFGLTPKSIEEISIGSMTTLYLFIAALFAIAAIIFSVAKLPKTTSNEAMEKSPKATRVLLIIAVLFFPVLISSYFESQFGIKKSIIIITSLVAILGLLFWSMFEARKNKEGWGAMAYPQLTLGMIAIFVYVGVEVTIDNNFGAFLKRPEFGGLQEHEISNWISLYWGSLMIGRWTGAVNVFNVSKKTKQLLTIIAPFIAFSVILAVNLFKGNDVSDFGWYLICLVVLIAANLYSNERPLKLLVTVCALGTLACLVALLTKGAVAKFAVVSCGLFCSVMWPCIFAAAVAGLGKYTSQGSAFLITMILGGAIIPPFQGSFIDLDKLNVATGHTEGPWTQLSYLVPLACFAYLIWNTIATKRELLKQGIDLDAAPVKAGGGH